LEQHLAQADFDIMHLEQEVGGLGGWVGRRAGGLSAWVGGRAGGWVSGWVGLRGWQCILWQWQIAAVPMAQLAARVVVPAALPTPSTHHPLPAPHPCCSSLRWAWGTWAVLLPWEAQSTLEARLTRTRHPSGQPRA
jgi:hypothetical protein